MTRNDITSTTNSIADLRKIRDDFWARGNTKWAGLAAEEIARREALGEEDQDPLPRPG